MRQLKKVSSGLFLCVLIALISTFISSLTPHHIISPGVFALLIGMFINPFISKYNIFKKGFNFASKKLLRLAIIFMGASLSFSQVIKVGKLSLIVMLFTLTAAFGGGYLIGKLFKMPWRLSGLISAGTGICGGSAIATVAPVIDAEDSDIAYAISATFIFDIIMVILFPLLGKYFNMTDLGFGLWTGTAVNDTSSVVAAGYAFSDAAGSFSVIVKLTRTLSIIPVVLTFSYINERLKSRNISKHKTFDKQLQLKKIFPWFILLFLGMVLIKSIGILPDTASNVISSTSKFLMVMALGAIGLKTNYSSLMKSGLTPMLHGFIISALVVIVSLLVQIVIGIV